MIGLNKLLNIQKKKKRDDLGDETIKLLIEAGFTFAQAVMLVNEIKNNKAFDKEN